MAISGSGSQGNPYIVDTWIDFEMVNTEANQNKYVEFSNPGSVELVALHRDGLDGFDFWPHINGNGFNVKNLYLVGSNPVVFHNEVRNLNILNFCYVGTADCIFYFKGDTDFLNINGITLCESTNILKFDENVLLWNSSISVVVKSSDFLLIKGNYGGITYSRVNLWVQSDTAAFTENNTSPTISFSTFTGYIYSPNISNLFVNSNTFEYNVYDLTLSSSTTIPSGGSNLSSASIYNNEKMTVTTASNNIIGCSSDQMIDSEYLRQHGFAMAY